MEDIIRSFLKHQVKYLKKGKSCAENLLMGILKLYNERGGAIESCIRDVVVSYTRSKANAIYIFQEFNEYYKVKTGEALDLTFPPQAVYNEFDRLMFIAKYLQDPTHTVKDLCEILWVSEATISTDIAKLCGNKDLISIMGKNFVIPEMERERGRIRFASTAHPLVLTPNLSQVLVTLKGLKEMSEQALYGDYAMRMAESIWEQISDYAKNRIYYVMENLLGEDPEWYKNLECSDADERTFFLERSMGAQNVLWNCLKGGSLEKPLYIEYKDGNNYVYFKNCKVVEGSLDAGFIEIECEGCIYKIEIQKVTSSTFSIEELVY